MTVQSPTVTVASLSGPIPWRATAASEWTKLWSLRSTRVNVVLSIGLSVGLTGLVAVIAGATWDQWSAGDRAGFEPMTFTLIGSLISGVLQLVLGVTSATSEYSSKMIRLTLTATPRRGRLLGAKALVLTAIVIGVGLVSTLGQFLLGQVIFDSYGMPSATLWDLDALRMVLATVALAPLFPLVALALGFALRSPAGAITSVLALILVPPIFGNLLPQWWHDHVLTYLPAAASDVISFGHLEQTSTLGVGPAIAVVIGWLALFLAIAGAVLERRDA